MQEDVIAVFDIGKTNKKILLFNKSLQVVYQEEIKFPEIKDDDGFNCDDIEALEVWILQTLKKIISGREFDVKGINFSTYGATLVYLDKGGKRLTPVYNYLKPMPEGVLDDFYEKYGGIKEFSRKTASPALGMLNAGLQIYWLKKEKPLVFSRVKYILHFPQYLSYLLTHRINSEYTSIGCHTAMWDFDKRKYHQWLSDEGISLPAPESNSISYETDIFGKKIPVGIGIHDSSASLVPYILGSKKKFILLSTGTWCINMNPFNAEPLTKKQLENDCLCYMSINQEQVKSSRIFLGYIHEVNTARIASHFGRKEDFYKKVKTDSDLITQLQVNSRNERVFFKNGVPREYVDKNVPLDQFASAEEAYYRLMIDITDLCMDSLKLIIPKKDETGQLYISGGFARNEIFIKLLTDRFPDKAVYTSEIDNSSALGAALVVYEHSGFGRWPSLNLGFKQGHSPTM